jgi:hypothetical protein
MKGKGMSTNFNPLQSALIAVQTGSPILLWGEPGIGKTQQIMEFAKSVHRHIEVVLASIRDPTDFLGLPVVESVINHSSDHSTEGMSLKLRNDVKRVRYVPPEWALNLVDAKNGILFLDEVNTAPRAVQAALLRVVLDKVVGECQLPMDTWIMAAANPPELSAGGQDLPASFSNRFCHFNVDADQASWRDWLLGINRVHEIPVLDSSWENNIPLFSSLASAYSQARPSQIQARPKNQKHMTAWPSLRSWTTGIKLLAAAKTLGEEIDSGLAITLLSSAISQAAAVEFISYVKNLDLPNPEDILRNPTSWDVKKRSDVTFAILSSVVSAYASRITEDRWISAWQVIDHVVNNKQIDVAVAAAHNLAKLGRKEFKNPKIILKLCPALSAII